MTNTDICPFCEKIVRNHDKAICCDLCIKWIHIRCNNLNLNLSEKENIMRTCLTVNIET